MARPAPPPPPAGPEPRLHLGRCQVRHCSHCMAMTVQVLDDTGRAPAESTARGTCLQCIADGGTCCTLAAYNRWKETTP